MKLDIIPLTRLYVTACDRYCLYLGETLGFFALGQHSDKNLKIWVQIQRTETM